MSNGVQVLIDSDAFVGWMIEADAHHPQAVQIFKHLMAEQVKFATTSLVVGEAATVLSHRKGQDLARTFLDEVIEKGRFSYALGGTWQAKTFLFSLIKQIDYNHLSIDL